MSEQTNLAVIPANVQLPAHLQTADIATQIAEANAAAAGGIKSGGFPRISIKANKFHLVESGEMTTLMNRPMPGQPPLPMMCLEVVIVAANPAISHAYYPGEYVEGHSEEPPCKSSNGVTPDANALEPQHSNCAQCPQNQWGSKVSKLTGKDIKACNEFKQLAVLPSGDLGYKALGFAISKGSLTRWAKYIQALSGRGYPVSALVTNITFDATANGVLNFAFNRFLTAEEYGRVQARATGDDVKAIVQPTIPVPALPAPAATPTLAAPVAAPAAPAVETRVYPDGTSATGVTPLPAQSPTAAPAQPAAAFTFAAHGANTVSAAPAPAPAAPAAPAQEAPKRTRRPRQPTTVAGVPEAIRAAYATLDPASAAAQGLLATYPALAQAPAAPAPVTPVVAPAAPVPPPVQPAPPAATAPINPGGAFGGGTVTVSPPPAEQPTAATTASAVSLKERLQALLAKGNGGNGAHA